jgi:hypothetical protein
MVSSSAVNRNHPPKRLLAALWIAILCFAAVRCYGRIHYDPQASAPVTEEAVRIGYFLYTQGDWMNPFRSLPTGLTAHTAPGFPAFVAGIYQVFGAGPAGAYVLEIAEATVLMAQIALLPVVMRAFGTSFLTGVLASFIAALGVRRIWTWEANYVGLLLMIATLLACRYCRLIRQTEGPEQARRSLWGTSWLLGGVWGIILLTGPSAGSIWVTWLLLAAWYSRRMRLPHAWTPVLLVPLVLLAPWEWRNYKTFHAMIPVRGSFGLELRVSNNPCAKVTLYDNRHEDCYEHPNESAGEARKILALGEPEYNRRQMSEALGWMRANPRQAASLAVRRFYRIWVLRPGRRIAEWAINVATLLSLPGLFFLARSNRLGTILCSIFLVVYPAVYYLIQTSDRYRLPILWVTFGLAALGCSTLLEYAWKRRRLGELHA